MPIRIPDALPATAALEEENIFVMTEHRAMHQDIRPLRVLLLNLMPTKITTETQILRKLSNTPIQVEVELLQTASHDSKNTAAEHGQPFGDALHDADEERLQNFDEHVHRNCLRTICLSVGPSGERQPRPERAANTRKSAQGALPLSSLGNAITALRIVRIPTEKVHVCHFGLPRRRPAQRSQRATQPVVSRVPPIPPWLVHVADFMSDTT